MKYLADTVSIIYHLGKRFHLGADSNLIFRQADQGEHKIFMSAITLMEVLYLSDAQRISLPLSDLLQRIQVSRNYEIVPVDTRVVQAAVGIQDVPELHDRIIVATAVYLNVPILTPDRVITASQHVTTIW